MTPLQIETAVALSRCTFQPASFNKRFARDIASMAASRPTADLTEAQDRCLTALAYRYRRQMPSHLVPPAPAPTCAYSDDRT